MAASEGIALILKASNFAALKHRDQRRKNADIPYINHPIGVAHLLHEEGGVTDVATLVAAILHDTIEDTETTLEDLEREFGPRIAGFVLELTDDKTLPKVVRKRQQIEHARHMTPEAATVKLADKLYNLRDLATQPPPSWTRERVQGYFCWAYHVVESIGDVNPGLRRKLDDLFAGEIPFGASSAPALPSESVEREELLAEYLRQLEQVKD